MGTAYGATSPVKYFAETLYVEAHLAKGQSITLPMAEERALYVAKGSLATKDTMIPEYSMAILGMQQGIEVMALEESRIAIIGGEPFEPRRMNWNLISTRKEMIDQAKADWNAHRFPLISGDDEEFIPLPE
eukprot:TRINITY_DN28970_c0_g1_i1.p1 TRINITY_DN28970_c0_g1~~TRINITY_DN28970_c0_g1_i1.p1  ORF type:complete len:131 (+),score=15.54 TRINITY_DN28970_c0_g1_i1:338-730(+)